jgi:NodT family efflux transporter outer membrane factor (OMF) lipoprotein
VDSPPTLAPGLSLALLLTLTGCAFVPAGGAPTQALEVPGTWSHPGPPGDASQADTLADWWLRFDDPLLGQLILEALRANTSVAGAEAALHAARAQRDLASASLWPTLVGSAAAQRNRVGTGSAGRNTSAYQAGLDASWEVDIFGANRRGVDAADAVARASAATLGDVRVSLAAELALGYIALRGNQARLTISMDNLASQRETLQITEWRFQAGLVSALDTDQARTAAEQTAAQVPTLQTAIAQGGHALAILTGRPPASLDDRLAVPGPVPSAPVSWTLSLPAKTLGQRPDLRAAQRQVDAARARVSQAQAQRWPSLQLGGSLGLSSAAWSQLLSSGSVVAALLANVSVPILDGGAGQARVAAQDAALAQSQASLRAAVLTALREVEDALTALGGNRERLQRLQSAAQAATQAAALARQRYGSGLVDFQVVLETQRSQLATQDAVASASAELGADHVRLYKALGGGWTPDAADTAVAPVTSG